MATDRATTTDVRVWTIGIRKGHRGVSYDVRWGVAGKQRRASRKTRALADSFRAELLSAARRGERFDIATANPALMH